jgi:hypothetical protein
MKAWVVGAAILLVHAAAWADKPSRAGAIVGGKDEDAVTDIMKAFTKALGVKCNHCHAREGGKFDYGKWTKHKRLALWMYVNFNQKLKQADGGALNCNTCHQGKAKFLKSALAGD